MYVYSVGFLVNLKCFVIYPINTQYPINNIPNIPNITVN